MIGRLILGKTKDGKLVELMDLGNGEAIVLTDELRAMSRAERKQEAKRLRKVKQHAEGVSDEIDDGVKSQTRDQGEGAREEKHEA
jgi:hypothetical protein